MDENELSCTKHLNFEVLHITTINEPVWRNRRLGGAFDPNLEFASPVSPPGENYITVSGRRSRKKRKIWE